MFKRDVSVDRLPNILRIVTKFFSIWRAYCENWKIPYDVNSRYETSRDGNDFVFHLETK